MSKVKLFFKGLTVLSRSYAYAKMSQKTGMSIAEIDLFNESYRSVTKILGQKMSIFIKNRQSKNKTAKAMKRCKEIKPIAKENFNAEIIKDKIKNN